MKPRGQNDYLPTDREAHGQTEGATFTLVQRSGQTIECSTKPYIPDWQIERTARARREAGLLELENRLRPTEADTSRLLSIFQMMEQGDQYIVDRKNNLVVERGDRHDESNPPQYDSGGIQEHSDSEQEDHGTEHYDSSPMHPAHSDLGIDRDRQQHRASDRLPLDPGNFGHAPQADGQPQHYTPFIPSFGNAEYPLPSAEDYLTDPTVEAYLQPEMRSDFAAMQPSFEHSGPPLLQFEQSASYYQPDAETLPYCTSMHETHQRTYTHGFAATGPSLDWSHHSFQGEELLSVPIASPSEWSD
ncbi:hypothetical protein I317_02039 [Kwoniella heveanensis CBS 569]|nr:hypothetical protein I317_02039 [Kwoniella heveanensis CBS 569]